MARTRVPPAVEAALAAAAPYVAIAVGLFFAGWGVRQQWRGIAAYRWPTAQGTIVRSAVERRRDADSDVVFRYRVRYRYSAGGSEHASTQVRLGGGWNTNMRRLAERVVERYPVGRKVTVHYDPRNPREAVLEPGLHPLAVVSLVGGAALLALGLAFV